MLKQALIVPLLAVLSYWAAYKMVWFGFYRQVYNHTPGDCFHLSGIERGSEDIQALPNGLAFITSGVGKALNPEDDTVGKIYLFDFNNPKVKPVELKLVAEERYKEIVPHGLSLWTDPKTGTVYVYVINHASKTEAVDKFKFNSGKNVLEHIRRIENEPDFHCLNDLVVVGEDQFYFTNSKYTNEFLEIAFNLHWCSVGFFNGKSASLVLKGLLIANGITVSKDLKTLYLAHLGSQEIRVYDRHADNSLSLRQSIFLGTLPDNLDFDSETGEVWVGAHPSTIQALKHLTDWKAYPITPSQVLRIRIPASSSPSSSPEIVEVYSNDGTQLSGSSVAVRHKNAILIGSVLNRALYCEINLK